MDQDEDEHKDEYEDMYVDGDVDMNVNVHLDVMRICLWIWMGCACDMKLTVRCEFIILCDMKLTVRYEIEVRWHYMAHCVMLHVCCTTASYVYSRLLSSLVVFDCSILILNDYV